jgi:DNA-binding PucR family transcriptional regulator
VRRSFLEASQVADAAALRARRSAAPGSGRARPLFYRLPDLRLRGLLHLLRDDPRLQTFVERELGALLGRDPGTELIDVLAAYLAAGGNKAEAAKASHLARPTFYERLRRIERILGTDLSSPSPGHVCCTGCQRCNRGSAGALDVAGEAAQKIWKSWVSTGNSSKRAATPQSWA